MIPPASQHQLTPEHPLTARHPAAPHRRYLGILAVIFALFWLLLAIRPSDRADWALENALVAGFVIFMAATYRAFPLSRISYTVIFLYMCLHAVGAHYTYSEVPYDDWFRAVTGSSFNGLIGWERNHFDRLVHFSYGFLLGYPIREIFLRVGEARGFWGYFLPVDFTLATSAIFELIEWAAAEVFAGDLGIAYLGTQGDIWDAQKDMMLAGLGATLAMTITAIVNIRLKRDFAREWRDSLRVKGAVPLGEDEIVRMVRAKSGS
jgi:putative membrane protein